MVLLLELVKWSKSESSQIALEIKGQLSEFRQPIRRPTVQPFKTGQFRGLARRLTAHGSKAKQFRGAT